VAALGVAALGLLGIGVGADLISDLPSTSEPAVAARHAAAGFAPGIVAPTEVLVSGGRLDERRPALDKLQQLLAGEPHVAGVIGPADTQISGAQGVLITSSGSAARYVLILSDQPYGSSAISTVRHLERQLPELVAKAGLSGVRTGIAGDTALSGAITTVSNHDLVRVGLVALAVLYLILALFLRALLAPLLLLAATLLSVLATLGLTTWVFQGLLGAPGLTFYVPFAVTVLLLSFGSDYNIFLVGRIWQLSTDRPFRERILDGATSAGGAITTAGITLSLSFALLAIVPLNAFREFAFAMVVGILLDTFVVRSVLVPAMLAVLGPAAGWPSRRLYGPPALVRDAASTGIRGS
jgi:RND superfamily putative drug exporter